MTEKKSDQVTSWLQATAAILQSAALVGGVYIAIQEFVLKDANADRESRQRAFDMIPKWTGRESGEVVNAARQIIEDPVNRVSCIWRHPEPKPIDCDNYISWMIEHLDKISACAVSGLCDRKVSIPLICPYLDLYKRAEQSVEKANAKPLPPIGFYSRSFYSECAKWVVVNKFQL